MRDTVRDERGPQAPARPDAPARTPRYEEIFCALRDRIRGGHYPVGQKLPNAWGLRRRHSLGG